uniref:Uncharacterized protein n=1 Tax=Anguilla anguilla TaxID=7936 RepID=A0A0E9WKU8_ANGAN
MTSYCTGVAACISTAGFELKVVMIFIFLGGVKQRLSILVPDECLAASQVSAGDFTG